MYPSEQGTTHENTFSSSVDGFALQKFPQSSETQFCKLKKGFWLAFTKRCAQFTFFLLSNYSLCVCMPWHASGQPLGISFHLPFIKEGLLSLHCILQYRWLLASWQPSSLCQVPCYRKAGIADVCHPMWFLTGVLGNYFRPSGSYG